MEYVTEITRINGDIASASREQHNVAEGVHLRIVNINAVAERTSHDAQQRAGASSKLAELAGDLEREVSKYRYS